MNRLWLYILLLLTGCSTLHTPLAREPYYPLAPESAFQTELLAESIKLERKRLASGLTPTETLRLLQLQNSEARGLVASSPRYAALKTQAVDLENSTVDLRQKVESLRADVSSAVRENRDEEKAAPSFDNPQVRARYFEIARLWNQDENDSAFEKCEQAARDESIRDNVSDEQWMRFVNLRMRIALDRTDWTAAEKAYAELRDIDDCAPTTTEAGLLISLYHFLQGQPDKAYTVWSRQCDKDESIYEQMRRSYWLARYSEQSNPIDARNRLMNIAKTPMPSYYSILAHQRLGMKMGPPVRTGKRAYLEKPISVPSRVDSLLTQSEAWLGDHLRRESQVSLRRAALILEKDDSLDATRALLYTAHLHQASGSTLDAMRIYSKVVERMGQSPKAATEIGYDFIDEMFPRPHAGLVDSFTRHWGVDADFAYAIIRQESAFNPSAVSPANARGWMQLMPFLAEQISSEWGFTAYYDPDYLFLAPENLKLASYHLHKLARILPHPALIAASYNAGVKRVGKWWKARGNAPSDVFTELIPINETRNYVKLVLRNYYAYKLLQLREGETLEPLLVSPTLPGFVSTL